MGFFSPELSLKETANITHAILDLYRGGIPLVKAFAILHDQRRPRKTRDMLAHISDDLQRGSTLTEAFDKQSKYLSPLLREAVSVGEPAGGLEEALADAAHCFDTQLDFRRRVLRAATYPLCVLVAGWFVIPVVQTCVVMSMDGRDEEIGPFLLRFFLGIAIQLASWYALGWVLWRLRWLPVITGYVGAYVWPWKHIVRDLALSRFFRAFAITMGSGLLVKECLRRAISATENVVIEKELHKAADLVDRCASLQEAFARCTRLPVLVREMMGTGEITGRGPDIWRKMSEYLREDAYHRILSLIHVLDAVLIIGIAFLLFGGPALFIGMISRALSYLWG
ncbi:MAG: hypothetical protein AMXMBFR84_50970 [Candidatus Hydrogenedentota bacterium]